MRAARRAVWVGTFDREPFIAATLRLGTWLSLSLLALGIAWCAFTNQFWAQPDLHGTNVLQLLTAELHAARSGGPWPTILLHVGIAILLLIPFVRVVASTWYFAVVERRGAYALLTSTVAIVLAYILFLG